MVNNNPQWFLVRVYNDPSKIALRPDIRFGAYHDNFSFNPIEASNEFKFIFKNGLAECRGYLRNVPEGVKVKSHQYRFVQVTCHIVLPAFPFFTVPPITVIL